MSAYAPCSARARPALNAAITAIVVTYNRKALLQRCLAAVTSQTRKPDRILVVDNASTDGTAQWLAEWAAHGEVNQRHVAVMPKNLGGAGAFAEGLHAAIAMGTELAWLMDDDGYPASDCLERLVEYMTAETLDAVSPIHADVDNPRLPAFPLFDSRRRLIRQLPYHPATGGPFIRQRANLFNGMLIQASAVARVGLPRAELFIRGDEVDYLHRMRCAGVPFGTLCTATFFHPSDRSERVRFFGGMAWARDAHSDFKNYYMYRNKGLAFRERRMLWLLPIDGLRYALYFLIHRRGDFHGFGLWWHAMHDGLRKRLGRHPDF